MTEYKIGQIIRFDGSDYEVVGFDDENNEIPILKEVKVLVQFD